MSRFVTVLLSACALVLAGCGPDYSPNTYASNAMQQANKVEPAVVIGFRQVEISASGTVGAVSGGAAGGVLGAQADGSGISSALGTVGGALIGSLVGTGIEHATADTTGWEYIVRKPNGDLLSVTQREPTPIPLGQKVLVITGNQARIVPDYSTPAEPPEKAAEKKTPEAKAPEAKPAEATPAAASPAAPSSPTPLTPPVPASEPVAPAAPPTPTPTTAAPPPADTLMAPPSEPKNAAPPTDTTPPAAEDEKPPS